MISELAEEKHDGPGGLRVETRRGLVEEDEEGGLGSEFDTDRETLPLLHVETYADFSYERFSVSLHLEELDDLFDVCELFGPGNVAGLCWTGSRGKSAFVSIRRGQMEVELTSELCRER